MAARNDHLMVTARKKAPATLKDLEDLPPGMKGEIIEGTLYVQPRPRAVHQNAALVLAQQLGGPFQFGRGGPGGWWILVEPGIELPDSPEFSPDLAGWRRQRLPTLPKDTALQLVPDWICEILSPSNRQYDLLVKRAFYARIGVPHLWYIDNEARTLSASTLVDGKWLELGVYGEEQTPRVPPFEAIELQLADLWR